MRDGALSQPFKTWLYNACLRTSSLAMAATQGLHSGLQTLHLEKRNDTISATDVAVPSEKRYGNNCFFVQRPLAWTWFFILLVAPSAACAGGLHLAASCKFFLDTAAVYPSFESTYGTTGRRQPPSVACVVVR